MAADRSAMMQPLDNVCDWRCRLAVCSDTMQASAITDTGQGFLFTTNAKQTLRTAHKYAASFV